MRHDYPQWYRSLRAFLLGAVFGIIVFSGLQQLQVISAPLPTSPFAFILLFTQVPVALLLSVFEIGFAVARYRRLRREIDARAAGA